MEIEAFFSLFKKPFTVKYPFEPSPPPEGFRGRTEFTDDCVGCGACAAVCPPKAITVTDDNDRRVLRIDHGLCIFCRTCQDICPWDGIQLTQTFEMATLDKEAIYDEIEHDLIRCEGCGEVITTWKHMEKIRDAVKDVGLIDKDRAAIETLCPSCKRKSISRTMKETMDIGSPE
ncbi:MAG: 4Fe-4S dicluster domain-containing protein [Theionarchaea archaeon]|nr:4Fe-4S dicluster domain-containing protein [Theionarchaea archaeon]